MRILVVENEPRIAALICQGLEEEMYAVDVIGNGHEALNWLQTVDYDLVLLDLILPGQDGFQVCREYRACGGQAPIPLC